MVCLLTVGSAVGARQTGTAEQRVAERLRALQKEAQALASQEQTILSDLRKLEIERQMKTEELVAVEQDLRDTKTKLSEAAARADALRQRAEHDRPDVEARLVRIYKMGRAGYWRLLLDADDLQSMGRAYRTAAALTRLDTERVKRHRQTLDDLARERQALQTRAKEISTLQQKAANARAAADRAVSDRAALLKNINERQDLAAKMTAELEAAQQKLQTAVGQSGGRTGAVTLPLEPFRGGLSWPAEGIVVSRFGRQPPVGGVALIKNGIEISLAEGRPVSAIHEGVIIDHGDGAHSLYGHLVSASVKAGDRVTPQTRVGSSGRNPNGNPALYFELRVDGKPVDPLQWLRTP
jgi:septal ring factor EnvC (AmiA/AmiB activator)